MVQWSKTLGTLTLIFGLCQATAAQAKPSCSRPIKAAIAPLALSIQINDKNEPYGPAVDVLTAVSASTGCRFVLSVVPRARMQVMFQNGEADFMYASQSPERDTVGILVPALVHGVSLFTLSDGPWKDATENDLRTGRLRVNVVRGTNMDRRYHELIDSLESQKVLEEVVDAATLARKMARGRTDAGVWPATAFYAGALEAGIETRINAVPLPSLGRQRSGFYLSSKSLTDGDRAILQKAFEAELRTGGYWAALKKIYPPWALTGYGPYKFN